MPPDGVGHSPQAGVQCKLCLAGIVRKYSRILSHVYNGQGLDLTPITIKQ